MDNIYFCNNLINNKFSKINKDKIEKLDIIFWILIILTIALLIWYIFGKSPGTESLITALVASELALWKLAYKHSKELTKIKDTFGFVRRDIDIIRSDIDVISSDINVVKSDTNLVKSDTNIIKKDLTLIKKKLRVR